MISGHTAAVEACNRSGQRTRSAKKAKLLPVSAPFHCSLMKPAQDRLAADLAGVTFSDPSVPVVCNVDAVELTDGARSREALVRQVTGSVKWDQSVRLLIAEKACRLSLKWAREKFCGGLMRQIDRSKTGLYVGDEASLRENAENSVSA